MLTSISPPKSRKGHIADGPLNIFRLDFRLLGSVDMPILCKLLDINVPFIDENNTPDDQFPVKYNTQEFLKAFRC
jgi:hypothetical protein